MTLSNIDPQHAHLPEGFTPVSEALPSDDIPVLVLRRSINRNCMFEIVTARYMPDYRPRSPWQDLNHDALTDSGNTALAWREMPDWLRPNSGRG